jgi:GMP synthase (glutamine-hydrolysing)
MRINKPSVAKECVVILDFGSQYSQLIARRVRELEVYCELLPYKVSKERVQELGPKGIILSGGPASVNDPSAPQDPDYIWELGIPVLGICYGAQLIAKRFSGSVSKASRSEYGNASVSKKANHKILEGVPDNFEVWMSHGDQVTSLPADFKTIATSANCEIVAMCNEAIVGLQFHPEVTHTPSGRQILRNFLFELCNCKGLWKTGSFVQETVEKLKAQMAGGTAICGVSGGVDSTVAATLVHAAIGDRLTCIFVNNGLLRKDERENVIETFSKHLHANLIVADEEDTFLDALRGVTDPESKRRIVGDVFVKVFERYAKNLSDVKYLVQGTLYPDVIESAGRGEDQETVAANIKTHHNVGGLPKLMALEVVEPQRYLFKDEVRRVGEELGLPEEIVWRHPFPGPGLSVRIIGEATREKLSTLRHADDIFIGELRQSGLYRNVGQALVVHTGVRTVGVMGDGRTFGDLLALRAVTTDDWMTADWTRLPQEFLARVALRIVNEVPNVTRVVYDITSKPPATVEWE